MLLTQEVGPGEYDVKINDTSIPFCPTVNIKESHSISSTSLDTTDQMSAMKALAESTCGSDKEVLTTTYNTIGRI